MVFDRASKLRFRRKMRMRQHQVEDLGAEAEKQIEYQFLRRLDRLASVWRFVLVWTILVVLVTGITVVQTVGLGRYFQFTQAVPGGVLSEGMVGAFRTASPLYANSKVDTTIAKLVFSGLLKKMTTASLSAI